MNTVSPKSRLVATLLVIFLGLLGVHRFYVGKTGSGVAQLLLSCTGIGMIISGPWVFIDFIVIVVGNFSDKKGLKISEWNPATVVTSAAPSGSAELEKYAELRDKGILTEDEFLAKKKSLLGL